jgi:hypothetical protein
MQLPLSLKCSTRVGMYGFIESKSKHIGFYVFINVHFSGTSVYGPISAKYINRDLVLIYWSPCVN